MKRQVVRNGTVLFRRHGERRIIIDDEFDGGGNWLAAECWFVGRRCSTVRITGTAPELCTSERLLLSTYYIFVMTNRPTMMKDTRQAVRWFHFET